ncbi:hypothetical protein V3C99_015523 [Haemonchus contortus]
MPYCLPLGQLRGPDPLPAPLKHKWIHKKTWCSLDGKTRNEIDYEWKTSLQAVRVFRGADVGSDHHLMRASIKLQLKKQEKKVKVSRPSAVKRLTDSATTASLALELRSRFGVLEEEDTLEEEWTSVKRAIRDCAHKAVGR